MHDIQLLAWIHTHCTTQAYNVEFLLKKFHGFFLLLRLIYCVVGIQHEKDIFVRIKKLHTHIQGIPVV